MSKILFRKLNSAIEQTGFDFGPSAVNLFLNSPLGTEHISSENLKILETRESINQDIYSRIIFQKIRLIVQSLSSSKVSISKKSLLSNKLKVISFEEVRDIIRNSYKNQFELDGITKAALFSSEKLKVNDYVKFTKVNNLLIGSRMKLLSNSKEKLKTVYEENELSKIRVLEFMLELANNPLEFWPGFTAYKSIYSNPNTTKGDYTDLMLGDSFGVKIIDLVETRSEDSLDSLESSFPHTKIPGFKIVAQRFDDHRKRESLFKPGGLHYTLTDMGFTNFPVEVQVQGIKSFIFDKFGKYSHDLYSYRGKKSSK
ncbi:MAG: hypothetical protein HRU03_04510 [Nanoarchaeales archaeon]|nr:hypothetical protein [Nanoarchaeales archaeon]